MQRLAAKGLQVSVILAALGVALGLMFLPWLPSLLWIWGAHVPLLVGVFLLPVIGVLISVFLALFVSCDPHVVDHSTSSRAAMGVAIALPAAFALPVHVVAIWGNSKHRSPGYSYFVFLSGLLLLALGIVFRFVEQNNVVGIRDVWTLRSSEVWDDTHRWASNIFVLFGVVGMLLTWFVPSGLFQALTIVALFVLPTASAFIYSYINRSDRYQYLVR